MPTWFILGLISALATSLSLLVGKRLSTKIDPLVATFLGYSFSVVFQIVILVFDGGWPKVTAYFFELAVISGCLDAIALTSTMYALRLTALSIISPVDAFTPLFAVIAATIFLNQRPRLIDFIGIILIVCGAYVLNLQEVGRNWFRPISKLINNRGVQFMLLASLVKGISPIVQTKAIHQTYPVTALAASIVSFSVLLILLSPFACRRIKAGNKVKVEHIRLAVIFGAIASIVTYTGWRALSMVNPSYAVAVGRLSIVFGMIWGAWFLRERVTATRFGAGVIMLIGVVLLVI